MKRIVILTVLAGLLGSSLHAQNVLNLKSAKKTVLDVSVDGQPIKVERYVDNYVKYPNRPQRG